MASTGTQQIPQPLIWVGTRHRWIDLGLILFLGFVPLIARAIYILKYPLEAASRAPNFGLLSAVAHAVGIMALFTCLFLRQGRSLKEIGLTFQWLDLLRSVGLMLLALVATFCFWCAVQGLSFLIKHSYVQPGTNPLSLIGGSPVLWFIFMLVGPVFEEILVRGYLMTELISLSGKVWLATLTSIILQTSYHLYYGIPLAVALAGTFTVWAIYFAKSRRLGPVLFAHLLWDLGAFVINLHH